MVDYNTNQMALTYNNETFDNKTDSSKRDYRIRQITDTRITSKINFDDTRTNELIYQTTHTQIKYTKSNSYVEHTPSRKHTPDSRYQHTYKTYYNQHIKSPENIGRDTYHYHYNKDNKNNLYNNNRTDVNNCNYNNAHTTNSSHIKNNNTYLNCIDFYENDNLYANDNPSNYIENNSYIQKNHQNNNYVKNKNYIKI